jgi:hypothetical protein
MDLPTAQVRECSPRREMEKTSGSPPTTKETCFLDRLTPERGITPLRIRRLQSRSHPPQTQTARKRCRPSSGKKDKTLVIAACRQLHESTGIEARHGASALPIEERMASKPSLARSDIGAFMRLLPLALWVLGATAGMAKPAPQAPHAADEGQNVSAVSLIANPHRNLEPLFAVVTQKANTPYSQNRIEASAEALRKAGGFPKVDVNVVPDVSGLRVNFLLEPAYYLGVVSFSGAEKTFVYIRLLQVTTLSDEDPYDPARIPVAEDSLREFLHRNGFFLARVQGKPSIDDAISCREV